MGKVLFDSSIYITALRGGVDSLLSIRRLEPTGTVWLSSVVLEEMYAGAAPKDREVVESLERDFENARRILVPHLGDWTECGKVLARLASKHGYEQIGRARLTNDALIAISAGRVGIAIITSNVRDFARLAEFSSFNWSVV